MSDYDDRGAYSPRREEPLAFDARHPRRESGGGGPAPVMLILGAVILIAMIIGAVAFYRSGIRKDGEAPRVVGEPVGEIASAPPASAPPADDSEKLEVYGAEGAPNPDATPTFAPEPEQPVVRPTVSATPVPAAKPMQVAPQPVTPAAKPAPTPAAPAKPAQTALAAPPPEPKLEPAAPKPTAPKPEPVAATGSAVVQIGAFSNAAQADKGWSDAARAVPGAMAGKGKRTENVDVGGKTFVRTYVTGFSSKADAQKFCRELTAAGKSCLVR